MRKTALILFSLLTISFVFTGCRAEPEVRHFQILSSYQKSRNNYGEILGHIAKDTNSEEWFFLEIFIDTYKKGDEIVATGYSITISNYLTAGSVNGVYKKEMPLFQVLEAVPASAEKEPEKGVLKKEKKDVLKKEKKDEK